MAEDLIAERGLTVEDVRVNLHYDPQIGHLTRLKCFHKNRIGKRADYDGPNGYMEVSVNGARFRAHRVAWAYVYGFWPPEHIDHKNRDRKDNRIENLRLATRKENLQNKGRYKTNKSGYKGVCYNKLCKKWQASIYINGKLKHLGVFDTPELAHEAYCVAAVLYHGQYANFG